MLSIQPATQTERYTLPRIYSAEQNMSQALIRHMVGQVPTLFPAGVLGHQERKERGTTLDMEPFLPRLMS